MLDANIKTQLKAYLEKLVDPIELVASLDDSAKSAEMLRMIRAGEPEVTVIDEAAKQMKQGS